MNDDRVKGGPQFMLDISSISWWCLALRGTNVMQNPMRAGKDAEKPYTGAILVFLHLKDNRNVVLNLRNNKSMMKIHFGNNQ